MREKIIVREAFWGMPKHMAWQSALCGMVLVLIMIFGFVAAPVLTEAAEAERVTDEADLLSDSLEKELSKQIGRIIEQYNMDVAVLTVEDYKQNWNTSDPHAFLQDYYQKCGYGKGEDYSGILVMVSMEERDWSIYISGDAQVAINNYGYEYVANRMQKQLKKGNYEKAFQGFVNDVEKFYKAYDKGKPYGDDHKVADLGRVLKVAGISAVCAAVLAAIIVFSMKSSMNTAKPQPAAREYVKKGSFVLNGQQDLYLYSTTTKTAIPKQSSSGGSSGGGSSSGSRGGSGGSGKF